MINTHADEYYEEKTSYPELGSQGVFKKRKNSQRVRKPHDLCECFVTCEKKEDNSDI